jgi:hypothetical protein
MINVNSWDLLVSLERLENEIEIYLIRPEQLLRKNQTQFLKKRFPLLAKAIAVDAEEQWAGTLSEFKIICHPQDP